MAKDTSKLLNHTTTIEPEKSAGEIMGILATKGARSVMIDYNAKGQPDGLAFKVNVNGNEIGFRLPSNAERALEAMQKHPKVPQRFCTGEQARRVAWRILKSWVESQMALIELGQVELPEVFFAYIILPATNQTLFQRFQQNPQRLLTAGEPEESNVIDVEFGT